MASTSSLSVWCRREMLGERGGAAGRLGQAAGRRERR